MSYDGMDFNWKSSWLPLWHLCHSCTHATLVITTVHRVQRWTQLSMVFSNNSLDRTCQFTITSLQIGSFLVNNNLILPCPVNNVCGAFSNRIFIIKFWLATKTSGDCLYCLEGLQGILTNSLRQGIPHLVLGFCLATYGCWKENFPSVWMCMCLCVCVHI